MCRGISVVPDRQLVAADRPDRRVLDRRVGPIAALHHVRAALVVAFLAHHRPNECDRTHLVGELLEAFGELDCLGGRRDGLGSAGDLLVRMRVKRLELAGTAPQPEQDDRLRRLARLLGLLGPEARRQGSARRARRA